MHSQPALQSYIASLLLFRSPVDTDQSLTAAPASTLALNFAWSVNRPVLMQAQGQVDVLNGRLAESMQQVEQSRAQQAQLTVQLQAAAISLEESQKQLAHALSECRMLRCQVADTSAQLQQVSLIGMYALWVNQMVGTIA